MTYVLEMSRYDIDTDLRDRSRFMTALMGLAPSNDAPQGEEGAAGAGGWSAFFALTHYYVNLTLTLT